VRKGLYASGRAASTLKLSILATKSRLWGSPRSTPDHPPHSSGPHVYSVIFLSSQAMFLPRSAMVLIPSSSFSTWPTSRPKPMFQ